MSVYEGARLKIERANHHIANLNARMEAFRNSNVATVEINPDAGNEAIKHDFTDKSAVPELALIAGDAIHNLKCALDYSWLETVAKLVPSAVSKFAKFPVYRTRDEVEAALRNRQVDVCSPALFDLVMSKIQPYDGGNFAIWPVHKLDIRDKHRLLIPVIQYSSIDGIETENQRTREISKNGWTWGTNQGPPLFVPMPIDIHVRNTGKVSTSVMFQYGAPRHEVHMDTFDILSRYILQTVELLESIK